MTNRELQVVFDSNLEVVGDVVIGRLSKSDAYSCKVVAKVPASKVNVLTDNCYLEFELGDRSLNYKVPNGLNGTFTISGDYGVAEFTLDSYVSQIAGNSRISLVIKHNDSGVLSTETSGLFFIYFRDTTERNRQVALEDYDEVTTEIQNMLDEIQAKELVNATKEYVAEQFTNLKAAANTWTAKQTFSGGVEVSGTSTYTGTNNYTNGTTTFGSSVTLKYEIDTYLNGANYDYVVVNKKYVDGVATTLGQNITKLVNGTTAFTNINVSGGSVSADLSGSTISQMGQTNTSPTNVGYVSSAIQNAVNEVKAEHKAEADKHIKDINLSYSSSNGVLTLGLVMQNGAYNLTRSIDLPLESAIVNASYDNSTKDITFTLNNGNTLSVELDDIISGLVKQSDLEEWQEEIESAEDERVSAETSRVSAESTRVSNEATRVSNETTRTTNEATRVSQESARVDAESSRTRTFSALQTSMETSLSTFEALYQSKLNGGIATRDDILSLLGD